MRVITTPLMQDSFYRHSVNRATPCLSSEVFLTVEAYIFQRKAAETERPTWTVPKLVNCALPAVPKW